MRAHRMPAGMSRWTKGDHDMNNLTSERLAHVVVVGAGFRGLEVVHELRNAPVHVTVIDRQNCPLFQPLLYQVATADLSPADISAPIRSILRPQRNAEVLLAEATGVDVLTQQVLALKRNGTHTCAVPYDCLVLATGARHSYFGHGAWAQFAPGLKTLDDATAIRRQILLAFEPRRSSQTRPTSENC